MDSEKLDQILNYIKSLDERLTKKIDDLVSSTKEEIDLFKRENVVLKEQLGVQNEKILALEERNRRNNVLILGVEEGEQNVYELEKSIIGIMESKLNVKIKENDINFINRIGRKSNVTRPVLVAFTTWRMKREILKVKRNLQNTNIVIKEDFSKEMREERKELGTIMMPLREKGVNVSMRGNRLLINGKLYARPEAENLMKNLVKQQQERNTDKRIREENEEERNQNETTLEIKRLNSRPIRKMTDDKITTFFGASPRQQHAQATSQ